MLSRKLTMNSSQGPIELHLEGFGISKSLKGFSEKGSTMPEGNKDRTKSLKSRKGFTMKDKEAGQAETMIRKGVDKSIEIDITMKDRIGERGDISIVANDSIIIFNLIIEYLSLHQIKALG